MSAWERLVREHDVYRKSERGETWAGIELRQIDRLSVGVYWYSETRIALELSFGHPGSDPVLRAGFALELPRPVADRVGEFQTRISRALRRS